MLLQNSANTLLTGARPGSQIHEQILIIDPRNRIDEERSFDAIDSGSGFEAVPRNEWELYVNLHIDPLAVKNKSMANLS